MKATLKLDDGREIAVDVSEETLKQIKLPVKKTGTRGSNSMTFII